MVQEYHGNPMNVVPKLEEYTEQYGFPVLNGLRIGFWRTFQEDFEKGVMYANQYPERYHSALWEEFGWWVGHNATTEPLEKFEYWKNNVKEDFHCILLHGTLRGWTMRELEKGIPLRDISAEFLTLSKCSQLG